MAIDRFKLARDYSLVITSHDRLRGPWMWEMHRKSEPLGIKNYQSGFKSENAAWVAGQAALNDFLDRLCREG